MRHPELRVATGRFSSIVVFIIIIIFFLFGKKEKEKLLPKEISLF